MTQGMKISFVVWPDGRVDENSLTIYGEETARRAFCASYLPEKWFGREAVNYAARSLWEGASKQGFRSYTIEIGEDGKPKIERV